MENISTKKINVLDGWHEVTIGQYQEISLLSNDNATARMIEVVSILTNEDPNDINKMEITSLNKVMNHLEWINKLPNDANYKPIITIDGIEYGFISRLTDLTVGDWIDLEHYLMDANVHMDKIFAILYRPLITAFNDRDRLLENEFGNSFEERALIFKNKAMIGDVYGAFVFFSLIVNESMKTIQAYLVHQIAKTEMTNLEMKTKIQKKKGLKLNYKIKKIYKVICGLALSTIWLKVILPKWRAYLKQTLS